MIEGQKIPGVRVCSAVRLTGTSAKTKKGYDMVKVLYLLPARDYEKEGFSKKGWGFETREISGIVDDALQDDFEKLVFLEPCDIYVANDPEDLSKNVIVRIEQKTELVTTKPAIKP